MRRLTRCGLFVLSFAVLSTVLFGGHSVNASTQYDSLIQTTDTLELTCNDTTNGYAVTQTTDVSLNWLQYFQQNILVPGSVSYDGSANDQYVIDALAELDERITDGTGWAVTQVTAGNMKQVRLTVTKDPADSAIFYYNTDWSQNRLYVDDAYSLDLYCFNGGGDMKGYIGGSSSDTSYPYPTGVTVGNGSNLAVEDTNTYEQLFINIPISYPTGYEGITPPDTYAPPVENQVLRPHVIIDVVNKDVSLLSPRPQELQGVDYKIYWFIHNATTDGDPPADYVPFSLSGNSLPSEPIDFTANALETYNITAMFVTPNGEPLEVEGFDFVEFSTNIHINGTSFRLDSNDYTCNENNFCAMPTYTCDELEGFFEKSQCKVQEQISFGVLNPSITAIKDLFKSFLVSNNPTCSLSLPNFTIFGAQSFPFSTIVPEACSNASQVRTTFPIISILANAVLALLLVGLIASTVNKLIHPEEHKVIEAPGL